MKISQSLIKDVLNGCCKHYYRMKYVENIQLETTPAMVKGLYFESELLGTSRDGKVEYPKLKNGGKSKAEQDIDKVIELAREVFDNSGVKIDNVQKEIESGNLTGHIDFMSDCIYDVKFTGETYGRWAKSFTYELHASMEIQANQYQKIIFDSTGEKKDFIFLIFSEHGWFRAIMYPFDDDSMDRHTERVQTAIERIAELEEPTSFKCSECRFNSICKDRVMKFDIENVNDIILGS